MFNRTYFGHGTILIDAVVPMPQVVEALNPTGDPYIDLFEFHLNPTGVVYLKNGHPVTWQGHLYEGSVVKLTGITRGVENRDSRPKVELVNPGKLYTPFILAGMLNKARVVRKKILRKHLEKNAKIFQQRQWFVSRVAKVSGAQIYLELRDLSDGPNFIVPARQFLPPEFPVVSLE